MLIIEIFQGVKRSNVRLVTLS